MDNIEYIINDIKDDLKNLRDNEKELFRDVHENKMAVMEVINKVDLMNKDLSAISEKLKDFEIKFKTHTDSSNKFRESVRQLKGIIEAWQDDGTIKFIEQRMNENIVVKRWITIILSILGVLATILGILKGLGVL